MKRKFKHLAAGLTITGALISAHADDKDAKPVATGAATNKPAIEGTAVETMNSGGYTYVLIESGTQKTWAASFPVEVRKGDKIRVNGGYVMDDFESPTLNRKFDHIYFVSKMTVGTNENAAAPLPSGHPTLGGSNSAPAVVAVPGMTGKVIETMNAGGYTYVRVKTPAGKIWAACSPVAVKVGDSVTVPKGAIMQNFKSTVLNRTFDEIYFVGHITVNGMEAATAGAPHVKPVGPAETVTVADILKRSSELAGHDVVVHGLVTKFTGDVMNRNWIHLVDASNKDKKPDIVVTTAGTVAAGDRIAIRGTVACNKDFGSGYKYPVLVEDGLITKE